MPVHPVPRTDRGRRAARGTLAAALAAVTFAIAPAARAATPALIDTIGGLPSAENVVQAADGFGTIYASTSRGVFRILPPAPPARATDAGWSATPLVATYLDGVARDCYYLGFATQGSTVFTVCTENSLDIHAPKHLMAIDPRARDENAPTLREVGPLASAGLPNGLAADGQGNLYVAMTGLLYPGSVHRITLSGTSAVVSDVPVLQFLLENPNGLKVGGGSLYVGTDSVVVLGATRLLRYPLYARGPGWIPAVVASEPLGFYDDFTLASGGSILAAEFLLGQVQQLDESSGRVLGAMPVAQPTSATVVTVGTDRVMLVTQRGAGQVAVYTDGWGVAPR